MNLKDKGNSAIKIKQYVEWKFARKSRQRLYFTKSIAFIIIFKIKLEMRRFFSPD